MKFFMETLNNKENPPLMLYFRLLGFWHCWPLSIHSNWPALFQAYLWNHHWGLRVLWCLCFILYYHLQQRWRQIFHDDGCSIFTRKGKKSSMRNFYWRKGWLNIWNIQVFQGNHDSTTPVQINFNPPFEARYVRVYARTWVNHIAMRLKLLGCMESSPESSTSASTVEKTSSTASTVSHAPNPIYITQTPSPFIKGTLYQKNILLRFLLNTNKFSN